jgi:hypothetical protein
MSRSFKLSVLTLVIALTAGVGASAGRATAPPVGPLPPGPTTTIETPSNQLVAIALPRRTGGRVWRIARRVDARVLRQVSEADVGSSVVIVFRAVRAGKTTVAVALTRGETAKALEARRYVVRVR